MNTKEKLFLDNIDIINKMIEQNRPKVEISKMLSIKQETLNGYFKKYGINYKGNQYRFGDDRKCKKKPLDKIFRNEIPYSSGQLRKRLIDEGFKEEKCECCGITDWNGEKIIFELHHIDGDHYNNELSNLKLLCPNCHSQTNTFRNCLKVTNKKKYENVDEEYKLCPICGKKIEGKRINRKKYCSSECSDIARRKLPDESIMKELIFSGHTDEEIANLYNSSISLVKKWRKVHNL